jgi:hypothetical protein
MSMLRKLNEKGIGGILIILTVLFIIIAIAIMAYFLLKGGDKKTAPVEKTGGSGIQEEVTADEVPLKICPTGDPEQCEDPILMKMLIILSPTIYLRELVINLF